MVLESINYIISLQNGRFFGMKFFPLLVVLEIVITRAAPAFHKLFMVMGCVFDINTVHKTVEKLTFQAFY